LAVASEPSGEGSPRCSLARSGDVTDRRWLSSGSGDVAELAGRDTESAGWTPRSITALKGEGVAKKIPVLHRGVALSGSERKQVGPVQIVVLGFGDLEFEGDILPELKRSSDLDVIRLVDMVIVAKSASGELVRVQAGSLSEKDAARLGSIAELLVGLTSEVVYATADGGVAAEATDVRTFAGDGGTWSVVDAIPAGARSVVALIEHRWAIPLRDAIQKAGGRTLAEAWIHPDDPVLTRVG
jgi:hypothetical protein